MSRAAGSAQFGQPPLDLAASHSHRHREMVVQPILARFEPRKDLTARFEHLLEPPGLIVHTAMMPLARGG
jgi:hypothetical protein